MRSRRLPLGFVTVLFIRQVKLVELPLIRLAGSGTGTLAAAVVPLPLDVKFARHGLEQRLIRGLLGGDGGGQFVRGIFGRSERRLRLLHFLDGRGQCGVVARGLRQHLLRLFQNLLLCVTHHDDVVRVMAGGAGRRLRAARRRSRRAGSFLRGQWRDGKRRRENKNVITGFHGCPALMAPSFSC